MTDNINLDFNFKLQTPRGEPNLNWAIKHYFIQISDDHGVNQTNRELYKSDYVNTICPLIKPGLAASDYTEEDVRALFARVAALGTISQETFNSRHKHLIVDPLQYFRREKEKIANPDWGAFYKFDPKGQDFEVALSLVKRTFTDEEAGLLKKILLEKMPTNTGEKVGIAICEYLGGRLNESAGMCFGDFIPMQLFPNEYVARIGVITSQLHKRKHKLGGKTRNAPRIVPVPDAFLEALFKRMDYIKSQIDFPFTLENKTYYSVFELPVACRKNNYTEYCGADDISKAARELFIEELKFRELRMSGISELMFRDPDIYAEEKDPTCYTCRRDYATELSLAFGNHPNGLSFLQYLMGHHIEDRLYRRNDFTDEYYLHTMKQFIEESHRVNRL